MLTKCLICRLTLSARSGGSFVHSRVHVFHKRTRVNSVFRR